LAVVTAEEETWIEIILEEGRETSNRSTQSPLQGSFSHHSEPGRAQAPEPKRGKSRPGRGSSLARV